jgi:hypothetical protein
MNAETWTAIATVAIAIFTVVLAVTSAVQGWLIRKQVDVARDELNATHRPKIIVHAIEIAFEAPSEESQDPTIGASIIYFNIGDTPALLTEVTAKITRRALPLQSGLGVGIGVELSPLKVPAGLIEPGQPEYAAITSLYTLEGEQFAELVARDRGEGPCALVLLGKIGYRDGRGIARQTGFCRRLDVESERWVLLEGYPEYEYAY